MKKLMHRVTKILIDRRGILIISFAIIFACKSQPKADSMNSEKMNEEIELLLQDAYYPSDTLITEVVKDEKRLQKFFAEVNMTRKPGIPIPNVDFSKSNVLIVCAGKTKSEGFPILTKSGEDSNQITITIEQPKTNKSTENQVISYPFSIYKVPKTEKEIVFKKQ